MLAPVPIRSVKVHALTIPTEERESDGTLDWTSTTMILVEVTAGGRTGFGYTYAHKAAAELIRDKLAGLVVGCDAMAIPAAWKSMVEAVRNLGRPGLASEAIAAVDTALWDVKARLLSVPLARLMGMVRESVTVYGSGGFTSMSIAELTEQLGRWAESGIAMVKMKVGSNPAQDLDRVAAARQAIGPSVSLMVDANGAYGRKQACAMAEGFARHDVIWFEEPVSSDDLEGLAMIRTRVPHCVEIAAGEYGYDLSYFFRMLEAGAVDVLQADATRCMGLTEFLRTGALCEAMSTPLSAHTAPALHLHACCALPALRHMEYFHDHVRIEEMLFEGVTKPRNGKLAPDLSRPGMGLEPRRDVVERWAA
ncbi:enolase C-terminal domain-like protein [Telmatospirillum sp. J64-1]|uniref:enolase C-terminal domain-like protein n=1 Tax=Telmatospirillum sp. J64-1 TaxID=2502183 RepID=UPI00115D7239|nr:enolase C-terminal domain-like protein [Telmatospirillum sp. J64-1]